MILVAALLAVGTHIAASAFPITGTVIDANQRPISGASVWLLENRTVRKARTDARGAFSVGVTAAGDIELVARKDGHALDGFSGFVSGPMNVMLRLGEPATVELRIVDVASHPIEGAALLRMLVDDRFHVALEYLADEGFPSVRSDESGVMVIPDLPNGSSIAFFVGDRKNAETYVPYLPVGGRRQDIRLSPGVVLCGRVTNEQGQGVAGALVTAYRMGYGARREFKETSADAEGFYRTVVAEGEYRVVARHADYAASNVQAMTPQDRDDENVVNLVLLTPRAVKGQVLDPEDKPASGVLVAYSALGRMPEESVTNKDGRYAFQAPAGTGLTRVIPPLGFYTEPRADLPVDLRDTHRADLPPVRLKPIPAVEGTVVDAAGVPAPRVLVASQDLDPPALVITEATGRFRLLLPYAPKDSSVRFRAEDAERFQRAEFVVEIEKPSVLTMQLQPFEPDLSPCMPLRARNNLTDLVGRPAPEWVCDAWVNAPPATDGQEQRGLALADLRGKVVVLTLWAGFDTQGPTRRRMAELCALHDLLKGVQDVAFLAIHDAATKPFEVERYVEEFRIPFPVGHDSPPCITFARYHVESIPQTVLIDKKGVVRYYDVEGRLLELIKDLRRKP